MSVPIIFLVYFPHWWLCVAMMPFIGLGPTMHGGLTATLVQTYAQPDYRSRMQSFVSMSMALAGFGTFIAGMMAEVIGVQNSIGIAAWFLTLITIVFMIFGRSLWRME
jgi:hypothetical protein